MFSYPLNTLRFPFPSFSACVPFSLKQLLRQTFSYHRTVIKISFPSVELEVRGRAPRRLWPTFGNFACSSVGLATNGVEWCRQIRRKRNRPDVNGALNIVRNELNEPPTILDLFMHIVIDIPCQRVYRFKVTFPLRHQSSVAHFWLNSRLFKNGCQQASFAVVLAFFFELNA